MALTPFTLYEIAEDLLGCVCAALDHTAAANDGLLGCPDCRTCIVPGAVSWDDCDGVCSGSTGGQLTVSWDTTWASTAQTFPAEDRVARDLRECEIPTMAAQFIVTLLRCAPAGNLDTGCPPSCEELNLSARQLSADAFTVYNSVLCCVPRTSTARRGRRFVMGRQRVLGPEGGCVGVEQRVTVMLPGCAPCDLVGVGDAG